AAIEFSVCQVMAFLSLRVDLDGRSFHNIMHEKLVSLCNKAMLWLYYLKKFTNITRAARAPV
ncbi:hypothetical protein L9F63_007358, partial [Diploptera punctata]